MIRALHLRSTARLAVFAFCVPFFAGCGGNKANSDNGGGNAPMANSAPAKPGLTGKQKVAILVGAAALYYVYKTHKAQMAQAGPAGTNVPAGAQLYRSRATGGIYYRDAQHRAHWVTVPTQGVSVPQQDYDQIMSQKSDWQNIPVHGAGDPPPGPND